MTRASKLTPQRVKAIREARANGASLREAAQLAGVHATTVKRWEDGRRGHVARSSKRPRMRLDTVSTAAKQQHLAAPPAVQGPSSASALELALDRHKLVTSLLDRLDPAVKSGTFPPAQWVILARYAGEVDALVSELTPPTPEDPNESEEAKEAERILLARLEQMGEASGAPGACARCAAPATSDHDTNSGPCR